VKAEIESSLDAHETRILLVRHGETEFNLTRRFQGRIDVPLNKKGKEQALALAKALEHKPLSAIYSSPLIRAMETARLIKTFHPAVPLLPEEGLKEMDLGEIDGMEADDWMSKHPEFAETWRSRPSRLKMPGGESLQDVQVRAMETLQGVIKSYPEGSTLLLCSHNFVNRTIICQALGLPLDRFREFKQDPAALNVLRMRKEHLEVEMINDVSHLKGDEAGEMSREPSKAV
jgi:probable phosphoglycerate mutase